MHCTPCKAPAPCLPCKRYVAERFGFNKLTENAAIPAQATAKEYGTTYGTTHEEEDDENDIRLETAADREALRSSDAFYRDDNIPAPQVSPFAVAFDTSAHTVPSVLPLRLCTLPLPFCAL